VKRKIKEVIKEDKDKEEKDSLFNEIKFKSQAAMEYLMTYGWAILIIALSLVVLYSLGIMNPKNFIPRAPPGSCFVFRPNGPGTTDFISLQGTCGYLPMYVASFDGVSGYVQIPNSPSLQPTNQITIEMWASVPAGTTTMPYLLLKFDSTSPYPGYAIILNQDGNTGHIGVWVGGGVYVNGITDIRDGKFHHIIAGTDGSKTFIYMDGKLEKAVSQTPNLVSTTNLFIGSARGQVQWFNGFIGNVQIYNTALTPQEIQYLYQQGLGGGPVRLQNLVGWWPLNGDAKDYSGNNNHGTINGGVTFVQNYNPP
jgi:hypothetical protein